VVFESIVPHPAVERRVLPPKRPDRDPQIQVAVAPAPSRPSVEMTPMENTSKRRVLLCGVGRRQNEPGRHALEPGGLGP
jgi:hypothetical protein